jgi:hypothetical protein
MARGSSLREFINTRDGPECGFRSGFAAGRLSGEWPKTQVRGGHLTVAARMSPGFEGGTRYIVTLPAGSSDVVVLSDVET